MARRKQNARRLEYDFHGLRVDAVAARLDAIVRQHHRQNEVVYIVHGKGEGRLAAEVERLARIDPRITDAYRSVTNPGMTVLQLNAAGKAPRIVQRTSTYDHVAPPAQRGAKHRRR